MDRKKALDFLFADPVPWMGAGACNGSGFDFVPDEETEQGLNAAQQWCRACPVRPQCLAWAMLHGAEGYWGGTSTYQRDQLRRVRTRAKCPLCLSTALVYDDPHELCLACGVSWVRDVREKPIAAVSLSLTNHGLIGSPSETENWLAESINRLNRRRGV